MCPDGRKKVVKLTPISNNKVFSHLMAKKGQFLLIISKIRPKFQSESTQWVGFDIQNRPNGWVLTFKFNIKTCADIRTTINLVEWIINTVRNTLVISIGGWRLAALHWLKDVDPRGWNIGPRSRLACSGAVNCEPTPFALLCWKYINSLIQSGMEIYTRQTDQGMHGWEVK